MALECTAKQMIDILDEHLPYEVAMMLCAHDSLYPTRTVFGFPFNAVLESFCIHTRNLFEFLTMKDGGGKNYAFAKAYVPAFDAFRDPQANADKDDLYKKICEQITHLSFARVKDVGKIRFDAEVPATAKLLLPEIASFVSALEQDEHRQAWKHGVVKTGLARWGF
jgi:hypothetical protein